MNYKKLMKVSGIAIATIMVILFLFVVIFYSTFKTEILSAVETYGYGAIFIVAFLLDLLFQPFAPDILLVSGILGGLNIYLILVCIMTGSWIASITGYSIGKLYGEVGIREIYGEKKYNKWKKDYIKYGKAILLVAALSPLPYTPLCWISGIFKMQKLDFFVYALLARTARFIGIAYLTILILTI